jgi:hypothetical protein
MKLGVSTLKKLGVCTWNKTLGFHRLSYVGGTSSSGELEITNFVDVVGEDNELRWGGYKVFD